MTDDDKAALIAEYAAQTEEIARAYCDWDRTAFDRWLERVKREAGAAALRDFAEALYDPGLIENHGGQEFVATSVIESMARALTARIERGE